MAILGAIFGFILGVILSILIVIFSVFGFYWSDSTIGDSGFESGSWTEYAIPTIVDTDWLEFERSVNPDLIVVAIASAADFESGHIPGAIRIAPADIDIAGSEDANWQSDFEQVLGDSGISAESVVVVYDHGDANSARLWWALTRLSHQSVAVLDGGMFAWESNGLPVEVGTSPPMLSPVIYYGSVNHALVATTVDVEAAISNPGYVIIDARTAEEFASGHIPGAVNIPAAANFDENGALLPIEELYTLYFDAGITPDLTVIVYCASGIRASSTALTLSSLGFWSVQVYAGSWPEWTSDPTRSVED